MLLYVVGSAGRCFDQSLFMNNQEISCHFIGIDVMRNLDVCMCEDVIANVCVCEN